MHQKVGRNPKFRVVPARMNGGPKPPAASMPGIVTDGPPRFEPSSRCSVSRSSVRSRAPAVMMSWIEVPNANPPGQRTPPSGDSAIGVGERLPPAVNEDALDTNATLAGEGSQAAVRKLDIPRVTTNA